MSSYTALDLALSGNGLQSKALRIEVGEDSFYGVFDRVRGANGRGYRDPDQVVEFRKLWRFGSAYGFTKKTVSLTDEPISATVVGRVRTKQTRFRGLRQVIEPTKHEPISIDRIAI